VIPKVQLAARRAESLELSVRVLRRQEGRRVSLRTKARFPLDVVRKKKARQTHSSLATPKTLGGLREMLFPNTAGLKAVGGTFHASTGTFFNAARTFRKVRARVPAHPPSYLYRYLVNAVNAREREAIDDDLDPLIETFKNGQSRSILSPLKDRSLALSLALETSLTPETSFPAGPLSHLPIHGQTSCLDIFRTVQLGVDRKSPSQARRVAMLHAQSVRAIRHHTRITTHTAPLYPYKSRL
jgi:hypothetical protein